MNNPSGSRERSGALAPGDVLCDRFEVLSLLGEGGMGQVWEALDLELREPVAIKTIRSDIADSPGVLARFKREVYATRRITHPNVCRTFDLESHHPTNGEADAFKITFLTMELLRGETLAQRIRRKGPFSLDQAYTFAIQVASALKAAHDAGIIHCDLKPANIFLTGPEARPRAVVTDFGIAKVAITQGSEETLSTMFLEGNTLPGSIAGTPVYMAPEQFMGRECTAATDVYCFGLVLYEALTGEKRFPSGNTGRGTKQELEASKNGATPQRRPLNPAWTTLLDKCLKMDPEERFSDVQEVLDLLHELPSEFRLRADGGTESGEWIAAPTGGLSRTVSPTTKAMAKAIAETSPGTGMRTGSGAGTTTGTGLVTAQETPPRSRLSRASWVAAAIVILSAGILTFHHRRQLFGPRGRSSVPSVAVLLLKNTGGDPALNATSEQIAIDLTNQLSQVSGLHVPPTSLVRDMVHSLIHDPGNNLDIQAASRKLGVDDVVTGTISQAGGELHLQIELVDAITGTQLWGESYSTTPAELGRIESDVSEEVAFRSRKEANEASGAGSIPRHKPLPAALVAYQKGKQAMADRTPESFDKAVNYFEQASDADPQYAAAVAELAHAYSRMAYNYDQAEAPISILKQAEAKARSALLMDSTSAEAYEALAEAELLKDYNWTTAEKDYKRAVELDPGDLPGHLDYALHLLTAEGRFAEARGQYAYGDRVVPKPLECQFTEAITAFYERRFDDSLEQAKEIEKQVPQNWIAIEIVALSYIMKGDPKDALNLLQSTPPPSDIDERTTRDAIIGIAFAKTGKRPQALAQLAKLEASGALRLNYQAATLAVAVGSNDKAISYLEKAYRNKEADVLWLGVDPLVDPLRQDPRFEQLLSELNLH
jgi:serine/threonine protein kinase/TolB-like protein/tetratricopeptide (TPR) repeat protein